MCSSRSFVELQIPVPFGYVAAKDWGPPNGRPVLAVHGWQDNAGSFDTLVPWLDPTLRIVAIDLPGHGFSSKKPPGAVYHFLEYLLDMKTVANYLKWDSFMLMGHSMGAGLSMIYSSVFPDEVKTVIVIDLIKPVTVPPTDLPKRTAASINQIIMTGPKLCEKPPIYSYNDALDRLLKGTMGSLTKASAMIILKRGSKPSEDGTGVVYTRDLRLQTESLQKLDDQTCRTYLANVKCNLLMIKGKNGFNRESDFTVQSYRDMFTRNCRKFLYVDVDGTHHLHLNNPATVAPIINSFVSNVKHSDKTKALDSTGETSTFLPDPLVDSTCRKIKASNL